MGSLGRTEPLTCGIRRYLLVDGVGIKLGSIRVQNVCDSSATVKEKHTQVLSLKGRFHSLFFKSGLGCMTFLGQRDI